MIEIYKDALDREKFYDLLKLKQQSIIKDYIDASVKRGTHESSTFKHDRLCRERASILRIERKL